MTKILQSYITGTPTTAPEFFQEPDFPKQYQALGLVQGVWFPRAAGAATGWLLLDDGCTQVETAVTGDAKEYVRSHPHVSSSKQFYNVYPRQEQGKLTFQVSFLHNPDAERLLVLEEARNLFRLRGDIRSVTADKAVFHIQSNVKPGKTPNIQFSLEVHGASTASLGEFWEVIARRVGYNLVLETATKVVSASGEILATQRPGTKGR